MAREWMHRSGIDVSRCKIITSLRGIEPVLRRKLCDDSDDETPAAGS